MWGFSKESDIQNFPGASDCIVKYFGKYEVTKSKLDKHTLLVKL